MSIRTNKAGRTIRLVLKGAITLGDGGGSLRRAVNLALRHGAQHIEIDASGVRYLDAAGLGELVACRVLAERSGARLLFTGVMGKTRELLRITGLEGALMRQPADERISRLTWRVA